MFETILENVREKSPVIHCITNYVTVNDVANVILASGASSIMADEIEEVEDITAISNSLLINIGTLNSRTIESMIRAGKKANKLGIPVILDPVGAGTSNLRMETVKRLLNEIKFSVIIGNPTEIKALFNGTVATGKMSENLIDESSIELYLTIAQLVSKAYNSVVVITGALDIITNSTKTYIVRNGHPTMTRIAGSGCMLTGLIAGYIGANPENILDSTAAAVATMGISGEFADKKTTAENKGTVSFRAFLIDYISKMDSELLNGGIRIEIK